MSRPKKLYRCFSCKEEKPRTQIARSGTRRFPGRKKVSYWHVCRECHAAWKGAKELDKQAYQAAQVDVVRVDKDTERMGWNGIPSDRSLRARKR